MLQKTNRLSLALSLLATGVLLDERRSVFERLLPPILLYVNDGVRATENPRPRDAVRVAPDQSLSRS